MPELETRHRWHSVRPEGFTLLELVVVLVLLALAAGLAAPALRRAGAPRETGLGILLLSAREAAARRGETIRLTVSESGAWSIEGVGSPAEGPIQAGEIEPFRGVPLTLVVSPVGSCGFDARSASAAEVIPLDPLSCTLLPPP